MEVHLNKTHGLRNDVLVTFSRAEIDDVFLHIANRDDLMRLPGLLRHVPQQDPDERRQVNACKISVEQHLVLLTQRAADLLDPDGIPKRRLLVVGSRNLGNNHGFIAWQAAESPKLFRVRDEPLTYPAYSCLVQYRDGRLGIRPVRFEQDRVLDGDANITGEVSWCVYGNHVLKDGRVVGIDEIIEQFYDIRHVLAFDRDTPAGRQLEAEIYAGYPDRFRDNVLRAWRDRGVPRNRFLHNGLGLSDDRVFILQREGTIEEMARWLKEAGARDGLILDNGASPFCWVWWLYPKGGFLFTAPDYRPNASAVIAFVLKGPSATALPGGSVSFSVV